jgi:hypothetical protein
MGPGQVGTAGDLGNPPALATAEALGIANPGQVINPQTGLPVSGAAIAAGASFLGSQPGRLALVATVDLSKQVDDNGVSTGLIEYKDPTDLFSFVIPAGTRMLAGDRTPLKAISVYLMLDRPIVPDDQTLISTPLEFGPNGASFDPPIVVSAAYNHNDLPQGFRDDDLALAVLDTTTGTWTTLQGTVDPANGRVTGQASHFSSFAVLTRPPASVNWPLTLGILMIELGLGVAGFVYLRRRRAQMIAEGAAAEPTSPSDGQLTHEDLTRVWQPALPPPSESTATDSPTEELREPDPPQTRSSP